MENTRVACLNFLLQMNQLEEDQVKEWELSVYYSQTRNEKEDEVHINFISFLTEIHDTS